MVKKALDYSNKSWRYLSSPFKEEAQKIISLVESSIPDMGKKKRKMK